MMIKRKRKKNKTKNKQKAKTKKANGFLGFCFCLFLFVFCFVFLLSRAVHETTFCLCRHFYKQRPKTSDSSFDGFLGLSTLRFFVITDKQRLQKVEEQTEGEELEAGSGKATTCLSNLLQETALGEQQTINKQPLKEQDCV